MIDKSEFSAHSKMLINEGSEMPKEERKSINGGIHYMP